MASSAVRKTSGSGAAERDGASKSRAIAPGSGAAVTVFDGNRKVARVRTSGRGMGVEVAERDHDDDRERVEGVISPAARSQHDRGSNLHQRCRTGGVSRPRASIYTPSHTSTYSPVPAKSLPINQIPTQHPTPRCRNWVQGGRWGAPPQNWRFADTAGVPPSHLPRRVAPQRSVPPGRVSRPRQPPLTVVEEPAVQPPTQPATQPSPPGGASGSC